MDTHITIEELKRICAVLFEKLNELGVKKIKITQDYYWYIWPEEKYAVERKPADMTLGQLSDDVRDVRDILNKEYDPMPHNFLDLASVLAHIGEKDESDLIKESE